MTISRVELQGQITRAQDFTAIKHQEDNKGLVDQTNYQRKVDQNVEVKAHQVQQGDRAENEGKRFDAKEQGNGTYYGDGGRKRKKDEKEKDGKVVLKGHGSFDMKI
ncbi:MAG: hypothetical protein ACI4SD_01460 [Suilimivivens sp.]